MENMVCLCRTAALGLFVRNVSYIQVPVASISLRRPSSLRPYSATFTANVTFKRRVATRASTATEQDTPGQHESLADSHESLDTGTKTEGVDKYGIVRSSPDTLPGNVSFGSASVAMLAAQGQCSSKRAYKKEGKIRGDMTYGGARKEQEKSAGRSIKPRDTPRGPRGPKLGQESRGKDYWKIQKAALKKKFPEGWQPRKKISPDAMTGIRALHQQFPEQFNTEALANKFEVSPEAIRRILKSKWVPKAEEEARRQERWFNRGKSVWSRWAELGKKPPVMWRKEGIVRDPVWNEARKRIREEKKKAEKEAKAEAGQARGKAQADEAELGETGRTLQRLSENIM